MEIIKLTQDQPGEEALGISEGDLGINALMYGQVQLYGKPKSKRELVQRDNTFQKPPKLNVSFDDQPPEIINHCEPMVGGVEERDEPKAEPQPVHNTFNTIGLPDSECQDLRDRLINEDIPQLLLDPTWRPYQVQELVHR